VPRRLGRNIVKTQGVPVPLIAYCGREHANARRCQDYHWTCGSGCAAGGQLNEACGTEAKLPTGLWTPRRADFDGFTKSRGGVEKSLSRAWTAPAGACVLACGLGLIPWVFERIARAAPNTKATVSLDQWNERGGLFVWEAFVTGEAKRATHGEDARAALKAFETRWPYLKSDVPAEPAVNLAVAAGLAVGLAFDPAEIRAPSIVIAA
jgi:hypothetical protein